MASDPQASASAPPPKPWELTAPSSGPTPFKPPSPGSTSNVVEASGTANPGEIVPTTNHVTANTGPISRPMPSRPWVQQNYGSTYSGYNSGYNSGLYGSSYGGTYGGGLYGNGMYGGGYGGGMCNNGFGGPMGGNGMAVVPHGAQDPNGAPASPPGFWISFLQRVHRAVTFCGNIAMLIDENTRALHMFMSALVLLLDRSGSLYGELARFDGRRKLARFVLGILGRRKPRKTTEGPPPGHGNQSFLKAPKAAVSGTWDKVWGGNGSS